MFVQLHLNVLQLVPSLRRQAADNVNLVNTVMDKDCRGGGQRARYLHEEPLQAAHAELSKRLGGDGAHHARQLLVQDAHDEHVLVQVSRLACMFRGQRRQGAARAVVEDRVLGRQRRGHSCAAQRHGRRHQHAAACTPASDHCWGTRRATGALCARLV
eukprot:scaffold323_cov414-Prasinococcus_capsulatus_cf.AAC.5